MKAGTKRWLILAAATLLFGSAGAAAQVYKVVDENGNVTYTDQPPETGAEAVDLPEIGVVETAPPKPLPGRDPADEAAGEEGAEPSERELRSMYRDFRLVSPTPDQSLWGTGNAVAVSWTAGAALQPGMQVRIAVDGNERPPTTAPTTLIEGLDRGEHTVSADLVDARGRVIASAEPVPFYIHQNSVNFNNRQGPPPRPQPRGGNSGG